MAAVPQRQAGFAMMLTGVSSLGRLKFAPSVPFSAHREIATPNAVCAAEIWLCLVQALRRGTFLRAQRRSAPHTPIAAT